MAHFESGYPEAENQGVIEKAGFCQTYLPFMGAYPFPNVFLPDELQFGIRRSRQRAQSDQPDFRSIFASDLHIGSRTALDHFFRDFLVHLQIKNQRPIEFLYLVGDVVDGWKTGRIAGEKLFRNFMHDVRDIMGPQTRIIYVPGNHDDFYRHGHKPVEGITIVHETMHKTEDGKNGLTFHGDRLDQTVEGRRNLGILGTRCTEALATVDSVIATLRNSRFAKPIFKLSRISKEWSLLLEVRALPDNAIGPPVLKAALLDLFTQNARIFAWNKANGTMIKPYIDFSVLGHTHQPARIQAASPRSPDGEPMGPDQVTLINLGCWTGHPRARDIGHDWMDKRRYPVCTFAAESEAGLHVYQYHPSRQIIPLDARHENGTFMNPSPEARQRARLWASEVAPQSFAL